MKTFSLAMFRIFLTLCLIGQPLQTALCDVAASGSEGGMATNGNDMGVASTSQASGTEDLSTGQSKTSNLVMGGIMLPKYPVTMDFQDAEVKDVLHLLALKSGLNIIYGADVT